MTTKAKPTKTTKTTKKQTDEEKEMPELPPPPLEGDRTAYEDSWYRSLRAVADRRFTEGDEDPQVPED